MDFEPNGTSDTLPPYPESQSDLAEIIADATDLLERLPRLHTWDDCVSIAERCELGAYARQPELYRLYAHVFRPAVLTHYANTSACVLARLGWSDPPDPPLPKGLKSYSADLKHPSHVRVALNEWPYSIPVGAEHWVIWSRLSVFPATSTKLDMMRGLSGFSWRDPAQDTPAGREMGRFVRERWPAVDGWEAIWFANPPALQSIQGTSIMELPWHAKHRRYELRDVIGVGGYSHVYRAYDHYICTDVAIKISLRVDGNPAAHEATMCGMLDHPHIPRLLDCFKTTRHWFLVFALEAGGELFDRIIATDGLLEDDAQRATRTLVDAVEYLHERNVIHRDIKPENILYRSAHSSADDFVLADYGLASVVGAHPDSTVAGTAGSAGYCSPEMLDGNGASRASDMWSLGVVVYSMLSGRTPYVSTTPEAINEEARTGEIAYPAAYWAHVPPAAYDFVTKCLDVDPRRRLTASEARHHLWLTGPRRASTISIASSYASSLFDAAASLSSSSSCASLAAEDAHDPKALAYPVRPLTPPVRAFANDDEPPSPTETITARSGWWQ